MHVTKKVYVSPEILLLGAGMYLPMPLFLTRGEMLSVILKMFNMMKCVSMVI
jgi:hypothetical protein